MLGGRVVRGSVKYLKSQQLAWHDDTTCEYDIEYDGELTPEVCQAITKAFNADKRNQPTSSWGQLRWSGGETVQSIDVERRKVITSRIVCLCD